MSILTESIRRDGEYKQLLRTLENDFRLSPLPILASGLCDGAADAFLVSLLADSKSYRGGTALLLCPEEKDCVRISGTLERYGIRTAFYMARDLTFYNITASHEYEHERLRVLSGLIAGDYCMNYLNYLTFSPGSAFSGAKITFILSLPEDARSIPLLSTPRIFAGLRFLMITTFLPMRSSGV